MFESSRIELSKEALQNNLRFILDLLPSTCTFSSVVKGNAYGHGIELYVPLAAACGINHFSTFSADEAYDVNRALADSPAHVMIMGDLDADAMEWAIRNGISFWIFDLGRLHEALVAAEKLRLPARIHLEAETGMNRNGLNSKDLTQALEMCHTARHLVQIDGICSHLAGAESISNHFRITQQRKVFDEIRSQTKQQWPQLKFHLACSAAVLRYPDTAFDLARVGIMQYGFFPTRELKVHYAAQENAAVNPLKRIITWKSRVLSVKSVKRGEFVGYGMSFQAMQDMQLATVPVGYAHGYSRSLSNHGSVLLHGKRVPVIGVVNMNLLTVDISSLGEVKSGDEVVLIGRQHDQEITVNSFSEASEQVNYELLTRLPAAIPRSVVA